MDREYTLVVGSRNISLRIDEQGRATLPCEPFTARELKIIAKELNRILVKGDLYLPD